MQNDSFTAYVRFKNCIENIKCGCLDKDDKAILLSYLLDERFCYSPPKFHLIFHHSAHSNFMPLG